MRDIADGDYVFGEEFNVKNDGVLNHRVLEGCVPSTTSGFDTDVTEGLVLFDTRPYSLTADTVTHDAEATLDRRYDVVVAREPVTPGPADVIIIKGTTESAAPPILAGDVALAVVMIDDGSILIDALHDIRYLVSPSFTKLPEILNDDIVFSDDMIGNDLLPWWLLTGAGSYAMQDVQGGAVRITTAGAGVTGINTVKKNIDLTKHLVYKVRARVLTGDYTGEFGIQNVIGDQFYFRIDFDGNAFLFVNAASSSTNKSVAFAPGTNWFTVLIWNDPVTYKWYFRIDNLPTDVLTATGNPAGLGFMREDLNQRGGVIQEMEVDYVKVWQERD